MDIIEAVVYKHTGWSIDDIRRSREEAVCDARFIMVREIYKLWGRKDCKRLGRHICRNHATVLHALKRYDTLFEIDSRFRKMAETIANEIYITRNPDMGYSMVGWICRENDGRPILESISMNRSKTEEWIFENFSRKICPVELNLIFR